MAQYQTRKATAVGKAATLQRRAVRSAKYAPASSKLTRSARPSLHSA